MLKNCIKCVIILLLLTVPTFKIPRANAATLDVCLAGCSYNNIQTAINAATAGDTISIGPGTYSVLQIIVNKPLTIIGSGQGQTIIDGGLANGSYGADGMIRITTHRSGEINLSGMTIQNASRKNTTGLRFPIRVVSGATVTNPNTYSVNLSNLEILGTAEVDSATDYGIYISGLANSLPEPTISLDNLDISGTRGNGILVEEWRNSISITNSELYEGPFGATSVFIGHANSPNNGQNLGSILIGNNNFIGKGVAISQTYPNILNGGYANIEILNNIFSEIDNTDIAIGIQTPNAPGIGQSVSNLLIEGNQISGVGYDITDSNHDTVGIKLTGQIDSGLIQNNEIIGMNTGLRTQDNASGSPSNILVTKNRLASNVIGIDNLSSSSLQAPANWWGCSLNPLDNQLPCALINQSPGIVLIDNWVVRTANLPPLVYPGETYTIPVYLNTLNTGQDISLLPSEYEINSFEITIPLDAVPGSILGVAIDTIPLDLRTWSGELFNLTISQPPDPELPEEPPTDPPNNDQPTNPPTNPQNNDPSVLSELSDTGLDLIKNYYAIFGIITSVILILSTGILRERV